MVGNECEEAEKEVAAVVIVDIPIIFFADLFIPLSPFLLPTTTAHCGRYSILTNIFLQRNMLITSRAPRHVRPSGQSSMKATPAKIAFGNNTLNFANKSVQVPRRG
jgi:hypothetical protein